MQKGIARSTSSIQKVLWVDLSRGQWNEQEMGLDTIRMFLGGLGLSSKILFEKTLANSDPLSAENIVIVTAGLLAGTEAPTAYRSEITTKSPLTGIFGSGNFGGLFGERLRKAGFEAIVLEGKAPHPVYLKIDNGRVELKDARHLWGRDTWETTDAIRRGEWEGFSVMAIGPAGENLVRFACPVVDYYHAPGRSHAGCVMGSKNLKAIAVKGVHKLGIAWPEMFERTKERLKIESGAFLRRECGFRWAQLTSLPRQPKRGGWEESIIRRVYCRNRMNSGDRSILGRI